MNLWIARSLSRIVVAAAVAAHVGAAHAADMTFLMANRTAAPVDIALFGRDRTLPAEGEAWRIEAGEQKSVPVPCQLSETICYGAWVVGDEESSWGAGRYNDTPCEDCCSDCARDGTVEIELAR